MYWYLLLRHIQVFWQTVIKYLNTTYVKTSSLIESLISSLLICLFSKKIIPQEIQVPLVVFFVLFLVLLVFCEVERVPFDAAPP